MEEREIIFVGLRELHTKKNGQEKVYRIITYTIDLGDGNGKAIDEFIGEQKYEYFKSLNLQYNEICRARFTMDFNRRLSIKEILE